MSSNTSFKPVKHDLKIIKLAETAPSKSEDFSFPVIKRGGEKDYQAAKKKYGPLAATDPDRKVPNRKDSRFALNSVLKDSLDVTEEEKRGIEERVQEGIAVAAAAAKKEGFEKGFLEGQKEGRESAIQTLKEETKNIVGQIETLVKDWDSAKNSIYSQNEKFLIELVYGISKKVIMKEVSTDKEYVARVAKQVIERMGLKDNILIKINPKDLENIQFLQEELVKTFGQMQNLKIEVSDDVKLGGCIVESEWSAINASLQTQLDNLGDLNSQEKT